jgi:hypothetical protein
LFVDVLRSFRPLVFTFAFLCVCFCVRALLRPRRVFSFAFCICFVVLSFAFSAFAFFASCFCVHVVRVGLVRLRCSRFFVCVFVFGAQKSRLGSKIDRQFKKRSKNVFGTWNLVLSASLRGLIALDFGRRDFKSRDLHCFVLQARTSFCRRPTELTIVCGLSAERRRF